MSLPLSVMGGALDTVKKIKKACLLRRSATKLERLCSILIVVEVKAGSVPECFSVLKTVTWGLAVGWLTKKGALLVRPTSGRAPS
ncbi:hypothetical protein [Marinobacterium arenosum]|uniref:hypothetical protein n=1 Tax=Marinobacterium arenosum TaxID=2862496 RepID=UPI001C966248|nr:hypothetical protein [Marinobacterium arenosum]MBY4678725.1 hypothetical protein [Marinobacterium arenosum]